MTANHSLFNHKALLAAPGIHAFDKFRAYCFLQDSPGWVSNICTWSWANIDFLWSELSLKKNACISITSLEDRDGVPCQSKGQVDDGYRIRVPKLRACLAPIPH